MPRTVEGAKKKGWAVVYFLPNRVIPWFSFTNVVSKQSTGHTVNIYYGAGDGMILFENAVDAFFAASKYNGIFR